MSKKYDAIFICHGNVNRSRIAEEILKKLRPDLEVDSVAVGVKSSGGKLLTKKMRTILDENEVPYNIEKRSKVVDIDEIESAGRVFVMDKNNIKHYKERFGERGVEKLEFLGEFIGKERIKDPGFSKGMDDFYSAYDDIYKSCELLAKEI